MTGVASSQTFKLQAAKRLLRLTPSQQVVLDELNQQPDPLSAQALHQILNSQRPLGLAMVYRALEALRLRGLIQWRPSWNGEFLYSAIAQDRLYLTCLPLICHPRQRKCQNPYWARVCAEALQIT